MPCIQLKTAAVVTSQPPHSTYAALCEDQISPATVRISAAGSSQEAWPPVCPSRSRDQPVSPQPLPPPPTLPVSSPVSRPIPLYPSVSSRIELVCEPPTYGRQEAGVSDTAATHQPAETMT